MASSDTPGLVPNRACRNCVRIKVKCIPLQGSTDNVCQRCSRLGKTCTTPTPVLRKQRAKSTRVTQLEERIDRLAALLTPTSQSPDIHSQPACQRPQKPTEQEEEDYEAESCDPSVDVSRGCSFTKSQPVARSGSPCMFVPGPPGRKDGSQLSQENFCPVYMEPAFEEKLFREFRTRMAEQYPFVVIDPNISAESFKETKPFSYWSCIYAASYRYRKLHQALHDEMMKALGHRMLVAGSKSLDDIQGLLLLIGWNHYISHYNPQLMNLIHLLQAILADKGIARPVRMQDRIRIASDTVALMHGTESAAVNLTADEKRALLGCFVLSSKASIVFSRMEPLRFSPHIEECCQHLKQASEYASDALLVEIVQLHRIFGKYLQVESGSANFSNAYRAMFRDEIELFRRSLPSALANHQLLEIEILSGSLCLLEPSYSNNLSDKIEYFNAHQSCLDAGNRLADVLTGIPLRTFPQTTFMVTLSLIQLFTVLSRLSFFQSETSGMAYPWRTVNLGLVLQRFVDMFDRLHQHEAQTYPTDTPWRFRIYSQKAQHVRAWFDAKVAAEEAALQSATDAIMPNTFSESLFGNFDDSMWHDLAGNWAAF